MSRLYGDVVPNERLPSLAVAPDCSRMVRSASLTHTGHSAAPTISRRDLGLNMKAPSIFRPAHQRSRKENNADADLRRGTAAERGYGARWVKASTGHKRSHPLCLGCDAVGRVVAVEVTDHVEPHKGDMLLFWDSARWQSACKWHHDVVKQMLERMYADGKIKAADLWLNSPFAVALTKRLLGIG